MRDLISIWAWITAPWLTLAGITAWWDPRVAVLLAVVVSVGVWGIIAMCRTGKDN